MREYNCDRHIELLKYKEELKKQNKRIITHDPIRYKELIQYSARTSEYLHLSQKNDYLQLIKDFLTFQIDAKEFDEKFSKKVAVIEKKNRVLGQNYGELKRIELTPRSLGFGEWISEIYLCCNEFYEEYNPNEGKDPALKTEEELRDAVTSLLPEIQKYF